MSDVRNWTPSQLRAVNCTERDLLLSAGAGAGKTATLTERVCRLVCDENVKADVSRMLIVTFTKAAAEELRGRVRARIEEALLENPDSRHLSHQMVALGSADISTMSSFFLKVIRPYFSDLGLPPSFKVADEAEIAVMKEKIIADVTDDFFDADDDGVTALADALSSAKDETSLGAVILKIANALSSKGLGAEQLDKWASDAESSAGGDYFDSSFGAFARETILSFTEHYASAFKDTAMRIDADPFLKEKYLENARWHISFIKLLDENTRRGYENARDVASSFSAPRLTGLKSGEKTELSEYFASLKDEFKKALEHDVRPLLRYEAGEISSSLHESAFLIRSLSKIVGEYFARFRAEKARCGVVDYDDVDNFAYRLLVSEDGEPTAAAQKIAKNYDYIFIDEYQDTNSVQDAIFSSVAAFVPRFMVGDVKQSIYAFRGGEPSVFVSYRNRFPVIDPASDFRGDDGTLFMSENFRSDRPVIDFVNLVSQYMFRATSTPFEDGDRLICKKSSEGRSLFPCEIALIEKGDDKKENVEAEYIAESVAKLLESGKRADGSPIKGGDVAILVRNGAHALPIEDALKRRGVAAADSAASEFFGQREILLVLCILNSIDNPLRDVYLAGALKSPVFGFSMEDLVRLRIGKRGTPLWFCLDEYVKSGSCTELAKKCVRAISFIERARRASRGSDSASLILSVYNELSLFAMTDGGDPCSERAASVRENLTELYDMARRFEAESFGGLYGFIEFLNKKANGKTERQKQPDEGAVTITTIHKSKGLEFPVCFLAGAASPFFMRDLYDGILFDTSLGIAMKLRDPTGLVKYDTALRVAAEKKMRYDKVCEETRVLYVALTRAAERLIVCCTVSDAEKAVVKYRNTYRSATKYSVMKTANFADLIIPAALKSNGDGKIFNVIKVTRDDVGFTRIKREGGAFAPDGAPDPTETIRERLIFVYPKAYLSSIPAKVTVSGLSPSLLDGDGETLTRDLPNARAPKFEMPTLRLCAETADGAVRGTATHVFLQFCDFARLEESGFDAELERLKEKKFLTSSMASLVDRAEIERFVSGKLFSDMKRAAWIRREFRFNASLPAYSFTTDEDLCEKLRSTGETITVQGVVDAVFEKEDGSLVLIDYKTDRLTPYESSHPDAAKRALIERHRLQLTYYKEACEAIFDRAIDEVSVYSLALGDTARVF